jgi:flagellar hook protein FlgE
MYYRKTNQANEWEVYSYSDGVRVDGAAGTSGDQMVFSTSGVLTTPASGAITIPGFNPGGGAATMNITLDVADVNQYGSDFSVNSLVQDGYTTGRLSGIDIADTGVVTARFTNGQSRTLAQVALANFGNPQGLRQLGDSTWAESFESGAALVGQPGTGSLGLVQSGALEGSNVDLTEQLVGMITAQRNFQANAQVITTADTVTQTIINIR